MSDGVISIESVDRGVRWRVEIAVPSGETYRCFPEALTDADLLAQIPDLRGIGISTWTSFVQHLSPNQRFKFGEGMLRSAGKLIRDRLFSDPSLTVALGEVFGDVSVTSGRRVALEVREGDDPLLDVLPIELAWNEAFLLKQRYLPAYRVPPQSAMAQVSLGRGSRVVIATAHLEGQEPDPEKLEQHAVEIASNLTTAGYKPEILREVSRHRLFQRLETGEPFDLLYLVAHGTEEPESGGLLALRDESLTGNDLAAWIGEYGRRWAPLQAVILCACSSATAARADEGTVGMAQRLLLRVTPNDKQFGAVASLGFRGPVGVDFALAFFERLFTSLGQGLSLEAAFAFARWSASVNDPQWVLPLLYSRRAAPQVLAKSFEATTRGFGSTAKGPTLASKPPRAPRTYFVGRSVELDKLREWYREPYGRVAQISAVHGEGGIGKTELAVKLSAELHSAGETVIWLERPDLDPRAALGDLLRLADPSVRLDDHIPLDALIREMHRHYGAASGLLVLDDLEKSDVVEILNPGGGWNVLVTTRIEGLVSGAEPIPLGLLSPEQAVELFSKVTWGRSEPPSEECEATEALVARCGYLPLAIELAGGTIYREGIPAADYLASFETGEGVAVSDIERVHARVVRSLSTLTGEEREVLFALAILPSAGVPLGLLARATGQGELPTSRRADRLVRSSLARWSPEVGRYRLHAHVRAAARREGGKLPEMWDRLLGGAGAALREQMDRVDEMLGRQTDLARERWLELREIFDSLDTSVWAAESAGHEDIASSLVSASQFRGGRTIAEREAFLDEAERLTRKSKSRVRALVLKFRGDLRRFRDDLEGASRDYDQALGLFEAVESRLGQANVLQARGALRRFRSDLEGASRDYDLALGLFEAVESRLGQANVLKSRGDLALAQEDLAAAFDRYREALAIYESIGDNLGRSNVLAEISRFLALVGELDQAESTASNALELARACENSYAQGLASQILSALPALREALSKQVGVAPPESAPPSETPPNTAES